MCIPNCDGGQEVEISKEELLQKLEALSTSVQEAIAEGEQKKKLRAERQYVCRYCLQEARCRQCSQCKQARYCSKACQSSDWPHHKHNCYHVSQFRCFSVESETPDSSQSLVLRSGSWEDLFAEYPRLTLAALCGDVPGIRIRAQGQGES